jgi:hypothetical protein
MVAIVEIQHGNPIWLSPSIVPSTDLVVTTAMPPNFVAPNVNSNDIFVYVKVDNPAGSVDLGVCTCTQTGKWANAVAFDAVALGGAYGGPNPFTTAATPAGFQIEFDRVNGDKLLQGGSTFAVLNTVPMPPPTVPPRRAYAFSPDGRFLVYVVSINLTAAGAASPWLLSIFALQPFSRADGTTVAPGSVIVSKQSSTSWNWTGSNFLWVGSSAVLASGPDDNQKPAPNSQLEWNLLCPSAPAASSVWSFLSPWPTIPTNAAGIPQGALDRWFYLVGPCESVIAFAPNVTSQATCDFVLVSLSTALTISFTQNNAPITVTAHDVFPSITTTTHTANGVSIDRGNHDFLSVDDPECTAVAQTVQVAVDRVKASTLPTANLGVVAVGQASAGPLPVGTFKWVQVPNLNGWANQGEEHWCLLAQAFTLDGTTIPRPWNGQMMGGPPQFPITDVNCAQRNIMISP